MMAVLGFERKDARMLLAFIGMNLRDKYLGSTLGRVWAIANPLLMLGIFTFVFGYVLKVKLPGAETTLSYAIWLISGYGPWIATTEALLTSAMSLVASANLVKNMAFKCELLPVAGVLTGVVPLAVSVIFLLALLLVDGNYPSWHALWIPVVALLQFLFLIGVGFFLSSMVVFLKDVGYALPNVFMVILFASPIFYPLDSMPKVVHLLSEFNPFYVIAESYREPLIYHRNPSLLGLMYLLAISVGLGILGLKAFRRLRGHFEAAL